MLFRLCVKGKWAEILSVACFDDSTLPSCWGGVIRWFHFAQIYADLGQDSRKTFVNWKETLLAATVSVR